MVLVLVLVFLVLVFLVLVFLVKTDNTAYQALVLVWLGCGKTNKTKISFVFLRIFLLVASGKG